MQQAAFFGGAITASIPQRFIDVRYLQRARAILLAQTAALSERSQPVPRGSG